MESGNVESVNEESGDVETKNKTNNMYIVIQFHLIVECIYICTAS